MAPSHAQVLADTRALLDFLAARARGLARRDGGDRLVHGRAAMRSPRPARFPDRINAMASLHGGFQVTERPDSAHLLIPRHQGRMLLRLRRRRSAVAARAPAGDRRGARAPRASRIGSRSIRARCTASPSPSAIAITRRRPSASGSACSRCSTAVCARPERAGTALARRSCHREAHCAVSVPECARKSIGLTRLHVGRPGRPRLAKSAEGKINTCRCTMPLMSLGIRRCGVSTI